jgi:hypothetical protein
MGIQVHSSKQVMWADGLRASFTFHSLLLLSRWYSAGLWAGWSGIQVPVRAGNFSPHHRFQTGSGAHAASYPDGYQGIKPPGREADHSTPTSAEVSDAWSYTSTPQIRLHGVVRRNNFTFYLCPTEQVGSIFGRYPGSNIGMGRIG